MGGALRDGESQVCSNFRRTSIPPAGSLRSSPSPPTPCCLCAPLCSPTRKRLFEGQASQNCCQKFSQRRTNCHTTRTACTARAACAARSLAAPSVVGRSARPVSALGPKPSVERVGRSGRPEAATTPCARSTLSGGGGGGGTDALLPNCGGRLGGRGGYGGGGGGLGACMAGHHRFALTAPRSPTASISTPSSLTPTTVGESPWGCTGSSTPWRHLRRHWGFVGGGLQLCRASNAMRCANRAGREIHTIAGVGRCSPAPQASGLFQVRPQPVLQQITSRPSPGGCVHCVQTHVRRAPDTVRSLDVPFCF